MVVPEELSLYQCFSGYDPALLVSHKTWNVIPGRTESKMLKLYHVCAVTYVSKSTKGEEMGK